MKVADPELTTHRTAGREPTNVKHHKFAVRSGRKLPVGRLPEAGVFQFFALVVDGLRVHILNCEMWAARAVYFSCFVVAGEVVRGIRLHGD